MPRSVLFGRSYRLMHADELRAGLVQGPKSSNAPCVHDLVWFVKLGMSGARTISGKLVWCPRLSQVVGKAAPCQRATAVAMSKHGNAPHQTRTARRIVSCADRAVGDGVRREPRQVAAIGMDRRRADRAGNAQQAVSRFPAGRDAGRISARRRAISRRFPPSGSSRAKATEMDAGCGANVGDLGSLFRHAS